MSFLRRRYKFGEMVEFTPANGLDDADAPIFMYVGRNADENVVLMVCVEPGWEVWDVGDVAEKSPEVVMPLRPEKRLVELDR